jgi:VWFA-related protein
VTLSGNAGNVNGDEDCRVPNKRAQTVMNNDNVVSQGSILPWGMSLRVGRTWMGQALLLVTSLGFLSAQQTSEVPGLSIRTTTRVVLVDAIVTDGKSEPVAGLSANDFTVLEDGKPQKVSFFSFESVAKRQNAPPPPRLRPDVYTNRPEYHTPSGPLTILLLDALNTPAGQQVYARQQMLKYLTQLKLSESGTAVLALGNSLTVLQDFTTNPELLIEATRNYVGGRTAHDVEAPKIEVPVTTGPGSMPAGASSVSIATGGDYASNIASQTNVQNSFLELAESVKRFDKGVSVEDQNQRVLNTIAALRSIGRAVGGYPGRKSLVWFSAGFPFSLAVDESMDLEFTKSYRDQIREAATILSDANVAVYPIDTRGLLSSGGLSDPSTPTRMAATIMDSAPGTSLAAEGAAKFNTEQTMEKIADETGGKAYRNTNDFAGAVQSAVKDGQSYYVLGYYPERKKWDGKFHNIKVVLNDKKLKVRSRAGYYAVDPADWRKGENSKQLISADAMRTLAATGVLFYTHAVTPEKKGQPVTVEILVDANTISYGGGPEGTYATNLDLQVGAFTPEGKLEKLESQSAEANLRRETYEQLLKNRLPVKIPIMLKPGRYLLRVAVRDNRNGHLGTLDMPVTVQ